MAGIALANIRLIDNWPGEVNPNLGIPTNGWDSTEDNFPTTAADTPVPSYPLGTKIMAYTDNSACPGYYTMMYLMYHAVSATVGIVEATVDFTAGSHFCFHHDTSDAVHYDAADTSTVPYYVVSSVASGATAGAVDVTKSSGVAIPCASISAGESSAAFVSGYGDSYGWFWVGGVAPIKDCTIMKGDDDLIIGPDLTTDWVGTANGANRLGILEYTGTTCVPTGYDGTTYGDTTAAGGMNHSGLAHLIACTSEA
jgi:hypothetical protein